YPDGMYGQAFSGNVASNNCNATPLGRFQDGWVTHKFKDCTGNAACSQYPCECGDAWVVIKPEFFNTVAQGGGPLLHCPEIVQPAVTFSIGLCLAHDSKCHAVTIFASAGAAAAEH